MWSARSCASRRRRWARWAVPHPRCSPAIARKRASSCPTACRCSRCPSTCASRVSPAGCRSPWRAWRAAPAAGTAPCSACPPHLHPALAGTRPVLETHITLVILTKPVQLQILRDLGSYTPDCDFLTSSLKLFWSARSPSNFAIRPLEVIRPRSSFSWCNNLHFAISFLPVFESGVNFHADNSFWVSSNLALVDVSSCFSLKISTLTAGSNSVGRPLRLAWEDFSSVIWLWKCRIILIWNLTHNHIPSFLENCYKGTSTLDQVNTHYIILYFLLLSCKPPN